MSAPSESPSLPNRYSISTLARNLDVLVELRSELAERLSWSVADSHVHFDEAGAAQICHLRSWLDLDLDRAQVEQELADLGGHSQILLLGVGLGEALEAALAKSDVRRVTVWDRDPWLLRLELMRRDYSEELRSGRLVFALGVNLVGPQLGAARAHSSVWRHPLLARIYHREVAFLGRAASDRRAMICDGELFVEQTGRALEARGFDLWTLRLQGLSAEELALSVQRFQPELLFAINYTEGLTEFAREVGVRLVVWEIDPATAEPRLVRGSTDHAQLFTYRRANVRAFERAGHARIEYLPLAADPEVRRPVEAIAGEEEDEFRAPISFVGASMLTTALAFRERAMEALVEWGVPTIEEASYLLEEVLAPQRADFSVFHVSRELEYRVPGFRAACLANRLEGIGGEDPEVLIGEIVASEKRLTYVASLADFGIHVWGDPGWRVIEDHGVNYRRPAKHGEELTRVYGGSTIVLDIGRAYQNDIVTMRVFDAMACGAFVLSEHNAALEELFEVGSELETYRDVDELQGKVEHFLAHPDEARRIGERGRAAVLARHTIQERMDRMLAASKAGQSAAS